MATQKTYVKPSIDPQVHKVIQELREQASKTTRSVTAQMLLNDMANRLENSAQAGFEDSYEYCCELIAPHIQPTPQDLSSVTETSLTASVGESLQYLIEFWLANRDKPGIDHCL